MDNRLIFVFFPVLIASSYALYNIGRLALQQLNEIRNKLCIFLFYSTILFVLNRFKLLFLNFIIFLLTFFYFCVIMIVVV